MTAGDLVFIDDPVIGPVRQQGALTPPSRYLMVPPGTAASRAGP